MVVSVAVVVVVGQLWHLPLSLSLSLSLYIGRVTDRATDRQGELPGPVGWMAGP